MHVVKNHSCKLLLDMFLNKNYSSLMRLVKDFAARVPRTISDLGKMITDRSEQKYDPSCSQGNPKPNIIGKSAKHIPVTELSSVEKNHDFLFYGFMRTDIVGVKHYSGQVAIDERVKLVREPHNQYCLLFEAKFRYDSNAIGVLNLSGIQVGHIPRRVAGNLAPFLDRSQLQINGYVPEIGRTSKRMKINLSVFGGPVDHESVTHRLMQRGIILSPSLDGLCVDCGAIGTTFREGIPLCKRCQMYFRAKCDICGGKMRIGTLTDGQLWACNDCVPICRFRRPWGEI